MGGIAWFGIPMGIATSMGLGAVALQSQGLITLTPDEISAGLPAVKGQSTFTRQSQRLIDPGADGSSGRRTHGSIRRPSYAFSTLPSRHIGRLDRTSRSIQYPDLRHLRHVRQQEPNREADSMGQSGHDCHVLYCDGWYLDWILLHWGIHGIPLRPDGMSSRLLTFTFPFGTAGRSFDLRVGADYIGLHHRLRRGTRRHVHHLETM